jgi:hypothetical protein
MKKILFFIIPALIFSCKKDVTTVPSPSIAPPVSAVPSNFIKKVVIESFTQTYCGQCPKGELLIDSLIAFNPGRVFNISYHVEDAMTDLELVQPFSGTHYYDSIYNPYFVYPSGIVNRYFPNPSNITPDYWITNTFTELSKIPHCGIAIEAEEIEGATLNLKIHVGFSANMFGEYRLLASIVENTVQNNDVTYDQLNDFSSQGATPDSTLPLYVLNDTIHNYEHKYVMRKIISPNGVDGASIPASSMTEGNDYILSFPVDLTGINSAKSSIVVFVDKYAPVPQGHRIENVQVVPIGESKDWN